MSSVQTCSSAGPATPPKLFALNRLRALPGDHEHFGQAEAFADERNYSYAPAVLSIITGWMESNRSHDFLIQATTAVAYDIDIYSSLLQVLKPLPDLVLWIREPDAPLFWVDIDCQGMDLRLELIRSDAIIRHNCIVDFHQSAELVKGDWDEAAESFLQGCRAVAQEVMEVGVALHKDILQFTAFRDWCLKCGCEL